MPNHELIAEPEKQRTLIPCYDEAMDLIDRAAAALREQDKRIEELESQLESQLSIAELAAQRGVTVRDVVLDIIGDRECTVGTTPHEMSLWSRYTSYKFTLPPTAFGPKQIKAVCGGGE